MEMPDALLRGRQTVTARALLVGERIDVRAFETSHKYGSLPLTVAAGESGCAVLMRYGVAVMFDLGPVQESSFLQHLRHLVHEPADPPEVETVELVLDAPDDEVEAGIIRLAGSDVGRIQTVADILAKSVMLSHYEATIASVFDRVEPLAASLERSGSSAYPSRDLLRQLGAILLIQHRMVGRVEVGEKPEILWDRPNLERLYLRLGDEYELRERHLALERKLEVVSHTAETLLDLLRNKSSLRVEWYIVLLIIVEIMLSLYQMFFRALP